MRIKASNANTPNWREISVRSRVPEALKPLDEIAHNMWWTWNNEVGHLFNDMDPQLWHDTVQNPVLFLSRMNYEKLETLAKDKQIDELTAMLKASQDQQATLASALTAAQALHAGTIQDRLTEHAGSSEDLAEDNGSLTDQGKEPEKKLGLFARIFGKKKG